jgi:DNA-binding beta-propeller fold protein YncE
LNTDRSLRIEDFRGKFVLLDFWTYCCINCMHVLPELKKFERAYANEVVVIGVHSAKFDAEKDTENIRAAILRHEIEHPVVNDAEMEVWRRYAVQSWPSLRLIDPEGNLVAANSGEIRFEQLDRFLQMALPYYRQSNLLKPAPARFALEIDKAPVTPLRFPGKVLADEAGGRLFISDSNHNRIVVAKLDGTLVEVIGSGQSGSADGGFAAATFNHPQGMAIQDQSLYVADTDNHLLRKIDLAARQVTTIAGTGVQAIDYWPRIEQAERSSEGQIAGPPPGGWMGPPRSTAIGSPWDLWIHQDDLYIAMAGPHQIWRMPLDESGIGPFAGNGREDIVDGPLLPGAPYAPGFASFAQPSGLTSDGQSLFIADSEGSSVRAIPFDPQGEARTIVGTAHLPLGRLFAFGDIDGPNGEARLQHVLGVTFHDGRLFVADTYNNKIKEIDPAAQTVRTLSGTGEEGASDSPARFDEPAGLSYAAGKLYIADTNNHLIRTLDLATGQVGTLPIAGLGPPPRIQIANPSD